MKLKRRRGVSAGGRRKGNALKNAAKRFKQKVKKAKEIARAESEERHARYVEMLAEGRKVFEPKVSSRKYRSVMERLVHVPGVGWQLKDD